jgi:lambda repressor-like predicted transcriptional regulator
VSRAAHRAALARDELTREIAAARAAGVSLREIAKQAGLSHESVRRLSEQAKKRASPT